VERGWNWASDENFVGNEEVNLGGSSSDTVPYVIQQTADSETIKLASL
jgi:hypothetical protein